MTLAASGTTQWAWTSTVLTRLPLTTTSRRRWACGAPPPPPAAALPPALIDWVNSQPVKTIPSGPCPCPAIPPLPESLPVPGRRARRSLYREATIAATFLPLPFAAAGHRAVLLFRHGLAYDRSADRLPAAAARIDRRRRDAEI